MRGVEAKVGADVREPGRQRARGPGKPRVRAEDRLVRQVDDHLGVAEVREQRHAVALALAQLLAAADEDGADPLVGERVEGAPDDVRGVLAVDQGHRSHRFAVTSLSIFDVYFSYSSVSVSNWIIRSCPWNG